MGTEENLGEDVGVMAGVRAADFASGLLGGLGIQFLVGMPCLARRAGVKQGVKSFVDWVVPAETTSTSQPLHVMQASRSTTFGDCVQLGYGGARSALPESASLLKMKSRYAKRLLTLGPQ